MKKIHKVVIFIEIKKRLLKGFTISLLLLLFSPSLKAQQTKGNFRDLFTQGNLMMGENFVDSALKTFIVLYPMDTSDANVCYYIGQLYLMTVSHRAEALPYLFKASKHVAEKYRPDDPYEKDAPPLVYYYLARAQHLNYQFDEAITNFTKFSKLLNKEDGRQKDVEYWINCCNNAKMFIESPVDCRVVNLGDSINSPYPDYAPVISADEQEILFTSRRPSPVDSTRDINGNFFEDIWASYTRLGGGWTAAQNLGYTINTPGNEAAVSLSADGQKLIMYRDNNSGDGNLYVSNLSGASWCYPNYIDSASPGTVNSPSWEPSACLSPDGRTLIFSSNRAGGFGGLDLYKVAINDSGKWGTPVNMGPTINTEYDEDAPFMHPDDSTLFFSSKGHNTMGGYDVFSVREKTDGSWGYIKNMGYPVNTPDDDIYFNVSADGKRAYYTSVRKDGYGEKDNYEVFFKTPLPVQPIAILVGYIKTPDGGPMPNDIVITASVVNGNYSTKCKVNPTTGKFLQVLRPNQTYQVGITTQGKTVFDQKFFLPQDSSYQTLSRAFFRTKIVLGDTTNVFAPPKKVIVAVANSANAATQAMSGRLLLNDVPLEPLSKMSVQLLDENGKVLQTTLTNSDGFFTFTALNPDSAYGLEVDVKDGKLKHLKKVLLVNTDNHTVRNYDEQKKKAYFFHKLPPDLNKVPQLLVADNSINNHTTSASTNNTVATVANTTTNNTVATSADAGDADFVRYFGYNLNDVSEDDAGFSALLDKIKTKSANGKVTIVIEASASKVPTKLFSSSNKKLASKRAKVAKQVINDALLKRNLDASYFTIEFSSGVKGPTYEHDAKDESKYQQFQYVKVYIR